MVRALIVCAVLAAGCKSEGERTDLGSTEVGSGSAKPSGSAGGFSATLSADLAKGSDTPALSPGSAASAPDAAAGSGAAMAGSGAAMTATGSGSAASGTAMSGTAAAGTGSGGTPSGSGSTGPAVAMTGSGSAAKMTGAPGAGSGSATKPGSGSAALATTAPNTTTGSPGAGSAAPIKQAIPVPGDLAAIKISLGPNWTRDVDEPGTFGLTVTVQSRSETATFRFHYGYDLAGAPKDREQYKKFLMEQKVLTVTADRQRGAAWYMEGVDSDGKGTFRFVILYGGKRLVCYGSEYKDSGLGDIRDEVVIQAKKICESLTL